MSSAVATAPTRVDVDRLTSLGGRFRTWQMRQGGSIFKMMVKAMGMSTPPVNP